LQAAADTLALSSLEVDLTGVEEGSTITVKWRGKPVFIQHRSAEQIATAAGVPLSDLKDPQKDSDRVVDPKVGALRACRHLLSCSNASVTG
jgi:ubiquinol-cytochrome c reductase iron-sulfur subunit